MSIGDWIAAALVIVLITGAILAVVLILYLAVWWQPDCSALLDQGRECRDWPWEARPGA